jgi:hypothetical protein
MTEPKLPPLDDDIRALLARGGEIEPAPPGVKAQVLERVEGAMGPFGGGGGGSAGGGGAAGARSAPASALPSAGWLRGLWPMAASFAVGSGITAAAMYRPAQVAVAPPIAVCPPMPAAAPPAPAPPPPIEAPAAVQAPPPVAATPAAIAPQPPPVPEDQLTAERRLLDVARRALEAEEPDRALQAVAQHERRFSSGVLVQERETMAIRALLAQGRAEAAAARAEQFRDRFPDSLLWPTIVRALQTAKDARP